MGAEAVAAAVAERFPQAGTATQPGTGPEPAGGEFVIFSKPELGRLSSADLAAVWDLFASSFAGYDVTVHRIKVLTGPELDQAGVMQQHYGVINQISRVGRSALTEAAETALGDVLADAPEDTDVLGGHQFLERYPEVSPFALAMLFSNAAVSRLGPGTYAATVRIDGAAVVILNGFHPRQLSFFTAEDAACAFLHGSSPTEWEVLRSELVGATDPSQANARSLRGTLYADPASFGLTSVNSNFNGVHMSAGPLEGLGELDRFFGEVQPLTDWSFARTLAAAGASTEAITGFLDNPVIEIDGERGTAFDLTEGVNPEPAAKLLVNARRVG
jgi:hypothetical protein